MKYLLRNVWANTTCGIGLCDVMGVVNGEVPYHHHTCYVEAAQN